jgi:hypothetical protein
MFRQLVLFAVSIIPILAACSPPEVFSSPPLPESVVYLAEGIDNQKIQMIWLEVPSFPEPGEHYVRIFLAKNDPPEPTIPNPNDLRCSLTTDGEFAILGPQRVLFTFMEDGNFTGSYTYQACPDCIECYMNWDYTLEMAGKVSGDTLFFEIAIVHFGHNVPGSYLSTELALAKGPKEPRIKCNRLLECNKIKF